MTAMGPRIAALAGLFSAAAFVAAIVLGGTP